MTEIVVDVVRVFVDDEGRHGNPLGVVSASPAVRGREQQIAASLGYSETVFLEPVEDGIAPVRIFTPTEELPFAGHPCVGSAWWWAERGIAVRALRVPAGEVAVRRVDEVTEVSARSYWAPFFHFSRLADSAAVLALDADAIEAQAGDRHHYAWAWIDSGDGIVRARMFAPSMGNLEDEATGAAAIRLTAELGRGLDIVQGKGSLLSTRLDGQLVHLAGRCVADDSLRLTLD